MVVNQLFVAGFLVMCSTLPKPSQGREFCRTGGYWCDTGHCCGNGECCTYYYELWWFWLVWFALVFLIGFCVWQRKRFRRQPPDVARRYGSISDFFRSRGWPFGDIQAIPPCKLPTYSEIGETITYGTPPPPYTYYYILPVSSISTPTSPQCSGTTPQQYTQAQSANQLSPNTTQVAIEAAGLNTNSQAEDPPHYSQISLFDSSTPVATASTFPRISSSASIGSCLPVSNESTVAAPSTSSQPAASPMRHTLPRIHTSQIRLLASPQRTTMVMMSGHTGSFETVLAGT